jgi:hypothetical protein
MSSERELWVSLMSFVFHLLFVDSILKKGGSERERERVREGRRERERERGGRKEEC